jgi:nitronate monooxygenase
MWPNNSIASPLGIDTPIIQAPMILQRSLVPLAAAVCNSGGLGSLGCAEMSVEELEHSIDEMRLATNNPFNLNFFLHQTPKFETEIDAKVRNFLKPFYDKLDLEFPTDTASTELETFGEPILELLLKKRPKLVSFHFGCPSNEVVDHLKSAGILVATTATTVNEAIAIEKAGADFVVAQGWEAGGHRGSFLSGYEETGIGTMSLVPQVVDAVGIPVIASGGIGDGRGIAAAFALGAQGVWMGTAFLSCFEAPITPIHRQTLLTANDEDTHLSRAFSGRPCRARKTPYSLSIAENRPELHDFPLMYNYSSPLKKHGIENDDLEYQFLLYGQSAALNQEMTAADLIDKLSVDAAKVLQGFGSSQTR